MQRFPSASFSHPVHICKTLGGVYAISRTPFGKYIGKLFISIKTLRGSHSHQKFPQQFCIDKFHFTGNVLREQENQTEDVQRKPLQPNWDLWNKFMIGKVCREKSGWTIFKFVRCLHALCVKEA